MNKLLPLLAFISVISLGVPASADERPDHYQGELAESLEQALANLNEYNAELAAIVAAEDIDAEKLNDVHQLTYTLEVALAKLRDELATSAEALEAVHQASERLDVATVKAGADSYLTITDTVLQRQ